MSYKIVIVGALAASGLLAGGTPGVASASARVPSAPAVRSRATALESAAQRTQLRQQIAHSASTSASSGLRVTVPTSVTTYNHSRVTIRPKVAVTSGVKKQVIWAHIAVYSGRHRVANGSSARLKIGRYSERVTVRYRSFRYLTRYRTVTTKTLHNGGYPSDTSCVIDSVSSSQNDGVDDTIDTAHCADASYPGQAMHETGFDLTDVPQGDDAANYAVGQSVTTGQVYFDSYYTTGSKKVAYKVRQYTGYHSATTAKRGLAIRDGGYVKFFDGGDTDGGEHHFTTKTSSVWGYEIYCGDYGYFGVNWSTSRGVGQFGPGYADAGESTHFYRASFHGHVQLDVFANDCTWTIGIFSKESVR